MQCSESTYFVILKVKLVLNSGVSWLIYLHLFKPWVLACGVCHGVVLGVKDTCWAWPGS